MLEESGYLIKIEQLKKIIEFVLLSPYLTDEKPLSLLIVTKAESGRSSVIKSYRETKGVVYVTDCTAFGIIRDKLIFIPLSKMVHTLEVYKPIEPAKIVSYPMINDVKSFLFDGFVYDSTLIVYFNYEFIALFDMKLISCIFRNHNN